MHRRYPGQGLFVRECAGSLVVTNDQLVRRGVYVYVYVYVVCRVSTLLVYILMEGATADPARAHYCCESLQLLAADPQFGF